MNRSYSFTLGKLLLFVFIIIIIKIIINSSKPYIYPYMNRAHLGCFFSFLFFVLRLPATLTQQASRSEEEERGREEGEEGGSAGVRIRPRLNRSGGINVREMRRFGEAQASRQAVKRHMSPPLWRMTTVSLPLTGRKPRF